MAWLGDRRLGLPLWLALCGCAAAHAGGGGSAAAASPGAANASAGSGAAGSAGPQARVSVTAAAPASPAPSPVTDAGPVESGSAGAPAVSPAGCGEGYALQQLVGGAPCEQRATTGCVDNGGGNRRLLDLISGLLLDCDLTLAENRIAITFERGCATALAIEQLQAAGTEPEAVACVAQRLAEQRFDCISLIASGCEEYEVSTLATQ